MKDISFEENGKKISAEEIKKFEEEIGFELPPDFVSFYLKNNGGIPEQYIYWKDDDVYVIHEFMPINDEVCRGMSVNSIYEDLCINDDIIPRDYLPFAEDSGGDFFLLKLGDKNKSEIYYWSHEYNEPEEMTLEPISEDFASFIEYLTDQHPED